MGVLKMLDKMMVKDKGAFPLQGEEYLVCLKEDGVEFKRNDEVVSVDYDKVFVNLNHIGTSLVVMAAPTDTVVSDTGCHVDKYINGYVINCDSYLPDLSRLYPDCMDTNDFCGDFNDYSGKVFVKVCQDYYDIRTPQGQQYRLSNAKVSTCVGRISGDWAVAKVSITAMNSYIINIQTDRVPTLADAIYHERVVDIDDIRVGDVILDENKNKCKVVKTTLDVEGTMLWIENSTHGMWYMHQKVVKCLSDELLYKEFDPYGGVKENNIHIPCVLD